MVVVVRPAGFEPAAPRLGIWRSILLSYGRKRLNNLKRLRYYLKQTGKQRILE